VVLEMGPSVIYCTGKKESLCVFGGGVVKGLFYRLTLSEDKKYVVLRVCICLCASALCEGGWM